jgi:hypothetical protein
VLTLTRAPTNDKKIASEKSGIGYTYRGCKCLIKYETRAASSILIFFSPQGAVKELRQEEEEEEADEEL